MKKVLWFLAIAIVAVLESPSAQAQCQSCLMNSPTNQTCWSGSGGFWGACWEEPIYDGSGRIIGDKCQGSPCTDPAGGGELGPVGPNKKWANLVIPDNDGNIYVSCTVEEDESGHSECAGYCDFCFIVPHGWMN